VTFGDGDGDGDLTIKLNYQTKHKVNFLSKKVF
jgi:hypothetical protein